MPGGFEDFFQGFAKTLPGSIGTVINLKNQQTQQDDIRAQREFSRGLQLMQFGQGIDNQVRFWQVERAKLGSSQLPSHKDARRNIDNQIAALNTQKHNLFAPAQARALSNPDSAFSVVGTNDAKAQTQVASVNVGSTSQATQQAQGPLTNTVGNAAEAAGSTTAVNFQPAVSSNPLENVVEIAPGINFSRNLTPDEQFRFANRINTVNAFPTSQVRNRVIELAISVDDPVQFETAVQKFSPDDKSLKDLELRKLSLQTIDEMSELFQISPSSIGRKNTQIEVPFTNISFTPARALRTGTDFKDIDTAARLVEIKQRFINNARNLLAPAGARLSPEEAQGIAALIPDIEADQDEFIGQLLTKRGDASKLLKGGLERLVSEGKDPGFTVVGDQRVPWQDLDLEANQSSLSPLELQGLANKEGGQPALNLQASGLPVRNREVLGQIIPNARKLEGFKQLNVGAPTAQNARSATQAARATGGRLQVQTNPQGERSLIIVGNGQAQPSPSPNVPQDIAQEAQRQPEAPVSGILPIEDIDAELQRRGFSAEQIEQLMKKKAGGVR